MKEIYLKEMYITNMKGKSKMKPLKVKENFLKSYMKKFRLKLVGVLALLIIILIAYFTWCQSYILNVFLGETPLDTHKFSQNTSTFLVGDEFELKRGEQGSLKDRATKTTSYWQGDKYEFGLYAKDVKKTDIFYTYGQINTDVAKDYKNDEAIRLYTTKIEDKVVLVISTNEIKLTDGAYIKGIFTEISKGLHYKLTQSEFFNSDDEISTYVLDIRGLEMESEKFDVGFCVCLLAIILFLLIKIIRYFVNYKITPTFKQLEEYGEIDDVENQIEKELSRLVTIGENGEVICENFIIEKSTFKLKISKNHLKGHSFKYV